MAADPKPTTAELHGRLWGARARDWAEVQEPISRPVYESVFARTHVGPGTRYLDVGCGAGLAAQIAVDRGARVAGIDAAEGLLAIARSRVPSGDFRHGDLEALPFGDRVFDVVTGFNAFQYAGNPIRALREARRVAQPDGAVVIVTWGDPDGMEAASLITALRPLLPPPPPGSAGPFALSDESALRAFAAEAGLHPAELFDVEILLAYPDEATALRGLNSAGVAVRAIEHAGEPAVREAHAKALAPFRRPDGTYRVRGAFRCLLTRP